MKKEKNEKKRLSEKYEFSPTQKRKIRKIFAFSNAEHFQCQIIRRKGNTFSLRQNSKIKLLENFHLNFPANK